MGLNVKNEDVERDVRELARRTGLGVTEAIGFAVREQLNRQKRRDAIDLKRILEIIDAAHEDGDPPVLDPSAFLYDDDGLPR
jgi:hypothetical protein